ncbi:MAG: hypothetical protein SF187_29350 [Deltaproteobacteria bacterium]|nr:hypothetical protein [Deltaproteobacteria bacterium]
MTAPIRMLGISLCLAVSLQACGGAEEEPLPQPSPPSPEELRAAAQAEAVRAYCGPQAVAYAGPLNTTADLTTMLNSLPRPLDVPCFVAALPRPVAITATTSVISLQPASGRRNPRIFMQAGGGLITSITMVGEFSQHVETSEPEPNQPGFTVKGDLVFPRQEPLQEADFYSSLITPEGPSSCSGCHGGEYVAREVNGVNAFASRGLKPTRSQTVPIPDVQALADECTADDATPRCRMLRALFRDPQAILPLQFAPEILTIFGGK